MFVHVITMNSCGDGRGVTCNISEHVIMDLEENLNSEENEDMNDL